MKDLRAPWLGSWKAPWELGRGRRWGDWTWALAAISQGWFAIQSDDVRTLTGQAPASFATLARAKLAP